MARLEQEIDERIYKYYITDSLQGIVQKKHILKSYKEIVKDIENPKPEKTGEQILLETIQGAELIV